MKPLLEQVATFCDDIIIVYFDHLLNGISEPIDEVNQFKLIAPNNIRTLCLPFTTGKPPRFFHNQARWLATDLTKYDYILYLDADEIPNGKEFKDFLTNTNITKYDGIDFRTYWYFRSAVNQAIQTEHCGLLVNKNILFEECMFTEHERWIFRHIRHLNYAPLVSGINGLPLMHHFSWVRTKEEMLTKVDAWGHKNDKDWKSLIETEFSRPFNGTDFVHGYKYQHVSDMFNIGL
jgi:hypothetical protein